MADEAQLVSKPLLALDDTKARTLRIATVVLFFIYSLPLFLLAVSALASHGWHDGDLILKAFVGLTQAQDQSFAVLHRAILPLMGAFAPLAFRGNQTNRWTSILMCLLLAAIALSLLLDGLFNAQPIQQNLAALGLFSSPDGSAPQTNEQAHTALHAGLALINSYFNRTEEVLGMYLLLLFGLKATDSSG